VKKLRVLVLMHPDHVPPDSLDGLTPQEALAGMTLNAARALGMERTHGTLEAGKRADVVLWEVGSPAELAYAIGANPCVGLMRNGAFPRVAT